MRVVFVTPKYLTALAGPYPRWMAAIFARMSLSDGTALVPLLRCEMDRAAELVFGKLSLRPGIMLATTSYARAASRAVGAGTSLIGMGLSSCRCRTPFVPRAFSLAIARGSSRRRLARCWLAHRSCRAPPAAVQPAVFIAERHGRREVEC
jgi:hypothetical protein